MNRKITGPSSCPKCFSSWIGKAIPKKDREFFGGDTHFKREIGVELDRDRIEYYRCPDCNKDVTLKEYYESTKREENNNV